MVPKQITELWAWVREDDDGEGEGILAMEMIIDSRQMFVPLVGADRDRIESHRADAQEIARRLRCRVKLMRFSKAEKIE